MHVVRSPDLAAEADPVVADDDVRQTGVDGELGELQRGEDAGAGDGGLGAEPPAVGTDGDPDLVGAGAVHGLGLGGDTVDVASGEAGVGERPASGVDDESQNGPIVLPCRLDFADADDGNGHAMTPPLMMTS